MQKINKNSFGLTLGILLALCHLVWVILVAVGLAKPLMDWILGLHFIDLSYTIQSFVWWPALQLIILTFVIGYVLGWVMAYLWNRFVK